MMAFLKGTRKPPQDATEAATVADVVVLARVNNVDVLAAAAGGG